MFMLSAAFFFTITLVVYGLFMIPYERKQQVRKRLAHVLPETEGGSGGVQTVTVGEDQPGLARRLLKMGVVKFRRKFRSRMNERKKERIDLLLLQAGRPMNMTAVEFRLLQLAFWIAIPALTAVYGVFVLRSGTGTLLLLSFASLLAAWRLPYLYVGSKVKKRAKKALLELPDVLDLLTVSLEAGLGFDAAVGKLVSRKTGVLADEFYRCLEEIRLGRTRREALVGLKERIALDEMRTLISSILQAEKLGIGMVQVLRVQSAELRDQRKQRAEEAAMKAPIKMMFPLVLFVFPCLFIVLLGPIVIQFIETFGG